MYNITEIPGKCTLFGMNGGCPESPDMKHIVYTEKDNLETDITRIFICDRDALENRRQVFEVHCLNHNSASASWIDNDRIVFRSSQNGLPCFFILDITGKKPLIGPIFAKESHCAENGIYPFSVSKEFMGKNPQYPEINECGIYLLNTQTYDLQLTVTEEQIINMVTSHGCSVNEHTAQVSHVQLNPSATAVMMRLGVKECPVFGALGCIDIETGASYLIKDKPVHQLWFDDNTYMATRQFNKGHNIEMSSSYIARFSKDGKELEILGGIANHIDGSPDRQYFAGDRCYPGFSPDVYLYKRSSKEPVAVFAQEDVQDTIWKKQVHPNPTFSRDGKRLYFNSPRLNSTVASFAHT